MGSSNSHARAVQDIANNTVNENTLNSLNKTSMSAAVEVLVKNANSCSSAVNQNNLCSVTNISTLGDFNFNSDQTNVAKVNFSCVNASTASADMANSMIQQVMSEIATLSGTEAGSTLNASALATNNAGFGGSGNSNSDVSTSITNNVSNKTTTTIENIVENNLKSNFSAETVNECIGKTTQSNASVIDGGPTGKTIGGNANINCIQTNTLEQIQECKQLSEAISKTLNTTAGELGLKVIAANEVTSNSAATASATSENTTTGPIGEITNMVTGILGAVFGAVLAPYVCSFIVFVIFACCIYCIGSKFMSSTPSASQDISPFSNNSYPNNSYPNNSINYSTLDDVSDFKPSAPPYSQMPNQPQNYQPQNYQPQNYQP